MNTNSTPDPAKRIADLEAELDRVRHERDIYKLSYVRRMREALEAIPPVTREEALELLNAPRSQETMTDVIAEYEHRLRSR